MLFLIAWAAPRLDADQLPADVRALWVVRTTLTSPAAIERMVDSAAGSGFNTLIVQVRGRGDAYYVGGLDPRPALLASDAAFDPLETTIDLAHRRGLRVHAWMNVNLVSGANELPASRTHVIYRHPEWLMVPRALADDLWSVEPRSPEYLGRLTRYARAQSDDIEGLYLSPISDEAADYTVSVVRDVAVRYQVDGVHLDYVRYPNESFDYSRLALARFRLSVLPALSDADRRKYDGRLGKEPLLYTEAFPERWRAFRAERMTSLMAKLRSAIKDARPGALISAAVAPDAAAAATERLQDWRSWIDARLVDVVCPMAYTTDTSLFALQIANARDVAGGSRVWAGIGAYRLSPAQVTDDIAAARRAGVGGIVLFSYDSLVSSGSDPDRLIEAGRALDAQKIKGKSQN